jgi:hypothetical protein
VSKERCGFKSKLKRVENVSRIIFAASSEYETETGSFAPGISGFLVVPILRGVNYSVTHKLLQETI